MQNNNNKVYIVVAFDNDGLPLILQYRNVLSWGFYNNAPKTFANVKTATRHAIKTYLKYNTKGVKVYEVDKQQQISSDMFNLHDHKEKYRIGAYVN